MTQQHMYLHLYEFLAAPPSVVRLQFWLGYRDRSVEKSREQYTSVISRSLDEGATVEDSYGPSHHAQREDGKRDSDLLGSRIE